MLCARHNIPKLPGCVEWMFSTIAFLIALGIAIRPSMHRQPCFTLSSRQYEEMYGLISFSLSWSFRRTQSRTSFNMASFPIRIASNFLLKIRLRLSVNLIYSAVSMVMVDEGVSVFEDVLIAVVEGELSKKLTQAFVGFDFSALVRGILDVEFIELFSDGWFLSLFWAESKVFIGLIIFILRNLFFRA